MSPLIHSLIRITPRQSPFTCPSVPAWISTGILASIALINGEEPDWERLPDMPIPRWEAGTVTLDGKLYTFGGYTMGTKSSKRADVFDPGDRSWTALAELPSAITHINAVLDRRTVWLAGGFKDGYKGYAISEVWQYHIDRDTYTARPDLPEPRAGGGLALVGRTLHYIGGLTKDRDTDSGDHWTLDLEQLESPRLTWKPAAPMPVPRNQFSTVTLENKIFLIGGQFHHDSGQTDQPRVDIYHPAEDSWSVGPALEKGHSHAEGSTLIHQGSIYLLGGMSRIEKRRWIDNEIVALGSDGSWKRLGHLPLRLSSPIAAILEDKLYVGGGSPNGANPQSGMWVRDVPR